MLPLFTDWIFPDIPTKMGCKLRIIITGKNPPVIVIPGEDPPSEQLYRGAFYLDDYGLITSIGRVKKQRNDSEGRIVVDVWEMQCEDKFELHGINSFGHRIDRNLAYEEGLTVFETIFQESEITANWRFCVKLFLIKPDGTSKIYFIGDIKRNSISFNHGLIDKPGTMDERRNQSLKLQFNAGADRLKSKTTQDLLNAIFWGGTTESTVDINSSTGDLCTFPFYAGLISQKEAVYTSHSPEHYAGETITQLILGLHPPASKWVLVASNRSFEIAISNTPPSGNRSIRVQTLLEKIALICDFTHDFEDDFLPGINYFKEMWNNSDEVYTEELEDKDNFVLSFNYVLGVNPLNGIGPMNTPLSYARDSTVNEIIRNLCLQFGCYLRPKIDQVNERVRLVLEPIRATQTELDSALILLSDSSKEDPRFLGNENYIHVKNKGYDGGLIVPSGKSGEVIDFEIPFRVKASGNTIGPNVWHYSPNLIHNTKLTAFDQYLCYQTESVSASGDEQSDNGINGDSWIGFSYLFGFESNTDNTRYPSTIDPIAATWRGFYALRAASEFPDYTFNRRNSLMAQGQIFGRHLVGEKTLFERSYCGLNYDNIDDIEPGVTTQIQSRNVFRNYEGYDIEIDILEGQAFIKFSEILDYEELDDLSARADGDPNSANGSVDASSSGGASNPLSAFSNIYNNIEITAKLVSLTNITLSGAVTIDGVSSGNSPILVNGQTDKKQNGLYNASSSGAWNRSTIPLKAGMRIYVYDGDTKKKTSWYLYTADGSAPIIGTSDIEFFKDEKYDGATIQENSSGNAFVVDGTSVQKIKIRKAGTLIGTRPDINYIAGSNISLTATDNTGSNRVDLTIAASFSETKEVVYVRCTHSHDFSADDEVPHGIPTTGETDGVTVIAGDKVLHIGESDQSMNGYWIIAAGNWTRSTDIIKAGQLVQVMEGVTGSISGGSLFYCKQTEDPTGSDPVTFGRVKTVPLNGSVTGDSLAGGALAVRQIFASGSAPTIAVGAGAGTGATCSISGKDLGGVITINAGTLPLVSSDLCTVTFNQSWGASPRAVIISAADTNARTDFLYVGTITPTTFIVSVNGVGSVLSSTTFKLYYMVIG